jgi:serine protease inhibitor
VLAFPVSTASAPINVDRPFLFFVIDKPTRSLLFAGRVVDPR